MKTPTKAESIAKLAQWCVENSSDTFSAFFEWSPHCDSVGLMVFVDGWVIGGDPDRDINFYTDELLIDDWVNETITELNTLLAESNERNSPENAAKLQSEQDAKELAASKAVTARLEGSQCVK